MEPSILGQGNGISEALITYSDVSLSPPATDEGSKILGMNTALEMPASSMSSNHTFCEVSTGGI